MSRLRVLDESAAPKIRPSRMSRRRAAVLLLVHVLVGLHIVHWLATGQTFTPLEPSEASAFSRAGVVNVGLIFFVVMAASTALFGRFFCGWGCHLVALQDLSRWLLEKTGRKPKVLRSRVLIWVPVVAFVSMFVWPAVERFMHTGTLAITTTDFVTEHFWATFPGLVVGGLTFVVCGFVAVYLLGAKGFCTHACPYGALFSAADRIAPLRIKVNDRCEGCGHCTAVCTSNVRVHEEVRVYGQVVDPGCMKCMDCVSTCPKGALSYGPAPIALVAKRAVRAPGREGPPRDSPRGLPWSEELVLGLAFVVALLTVRGLYGVVPFLMALGAAGCLAFIALLGFQLVGRQHVSFKSFRLKRLGRLLPAGRVAVVLLAGLLALWGHSAWVRMLQWQADRSFFALTPVLADAVRFDELRSVEPDSASGAAIERALGRFETLDSWALIEVAGQDAKVGWLRLVQGDYERARLHAGSAVERGEMVVPALRVLARASLEEGDFDRAADLLARVVERSGRDLRPTLDLALVLARAGRNAAATSLLRAAKNGVGRSSPDVAYNLGLLAAQRGDVTAAVAELEAAVALDPGHRAARETLAGVLASQGDFVAAEGHFREALLMAPEDLETRFLLARVLHAQGRLREAIAELEDVLRAEPAAATVGQLLQNWRGELDSQR